jgi:hypothetical protein
MAAGSVGIGQGGGGREQSPPHAGKSTDRPNDVAS